MEKIKEFNKKRREARHLFHESHGKKAFVVVSNQPLYFGRRNRIFKVLPLQIYSSHSSIKRKYPYEVYKYE